MITKKLLAPFAMGSPMSNIKVFFICFSLISSAKILILNKEAKSDEFSDLRATYKAIDKKMGYGKSQLLQIRERDKLYDTKLSGSQKSTFGDQITLEILRHLKDDVVQFSPSFRDIFNVPKNINTPMSLTSHPTCTSSKKDLEKILLEPGNLSKREVNLVQSFEKKLNNLRKKYNEEKNPEALVKSWGGYVRLSCLYRVIR